MKEWLTLAVFVAGCLAPQVLWASPEKESDAEVALSALAAEYWTKRLVEKDYQFTFEKELEKGSLSFKDYVERVKGGEKWKFLSVRTKKVEIDGDRGAVYLTVELQTPFMPKGSTQMLQDLWLYRSGQWKHKFSDQ